MHSRLGFGLGTVFRFGIPAVIEKHKHGLDAMPVRYGKEFIHTGLEGLRFMLPYDTAQIYTRGGKAQIFRPPEFAVDCFGVESRIRPHLYLIDGICRNIIASASPAGPLIPFVRFLGCPLAIRSDSFTASGQKKNQNPKYRCLTHNHQKFNAFNKLTNS